MMTRSSLHPLESWCSLERGAEWEHGEGMPTGEVLQSSFPRVRAGCVSHQVPPKMPPKTQTHQLPLPLRGALGLGRKTRLLQP